MQSCLAIRKAAQRIPATSKEWVLAAGIQNNKETEMRGWCGQYYQTPVWDRFLSVSSNISKNSSSQWPSKGNQSGPPFFFAITYKSIYLAGHSLSLGLKQWQNRKQLRKWVVFLSGWGTPGFLGKALLKCLYVLICIDVFIYSIFIRRPELIALWWIF